MTDVDADALKDLVRRANVLPYVSYGSPHDLSILEKISGYYVVQSRFRKLYLQNRIILPFPKCVVNSASKSYKLYVFF